MAEVIVGNTNVQYVSTIPSGSCNAGSAPVTVVQPEGTVYTCQNGTWTELSGGGGGGSPTGPAGGDLTGTYPNPTVQGISNATLPINISTPGAPSIAALKMTGAPSTTGTGTTDFPLLYLNSGATAPTSWSTNGTIIGVNAVAGFTGNVIDYHVNGGTSVFSVSAAGQMTSPTILTGNGSINFVGNAVLVGNNTSLRWAATAFASVTTDTTLSRASAGVLAIGAGVGAIGDTTGQLSCAAINLTGGTPAASTSQLLCTTAPFAGTGTNATPVLYMNSGATAPATWSTSGTIIGGNGPSGFTGNFLDYHANGGGSLFLVNSAGSIVASGNLVYSGANGTGSFTTSSAGNTPLALRNAAATPTGNLLNLTSTATLVANFGPTGALNIIGTTPAAMTPMIEVTAAAYTAGTASTNQPVLYMDSGTVEPTSWSANGTIIGTNVPSGFTGNVLDFHFNGGFSNFAVTGTGGVTCSGPILGGSSLTIGSGFYVALNTGVYLASSTYLAFSATTSAPAGAKDTYLSRLSAGNLAIGTIATVGDTTGQLNCAAINLIGGTPALSTSQILCTTPPFTAGAGSTNLPVLYLNSGVTQPTSFNVNGTVIGANAPAGFTGNLLDCHVNGGPSVFFVNYQGSATFASNLLAISFGISGGANGLNNTGFLMGNAQVIKWSSTIGNGGPYDTTMSRASTGGLCIGTTTTVGDDSGKLRCLLVNTGQITQPARLTGQTASIAATNIQTDIPSILPAGLYRLNYYLNVTTAGTAGTVILNVTWTDDTTAQTQSSSSVSLTTLGSHANGDIVLYTAGAVNVQFATTVAGATGTPAYALTIVLERLM